MQMRNKLLISSGMIALYSAMPTNAAADTAKQGDDAASSAAPAPSSGDKGGNGYIVVTAQKREQVLIDVPQSISVISADTLAQRQVNTIADYLTAVPGLQLVQSTPGQGRLILRGVNTGGVASTVAVYLDETPFGSSSGLANGAELAADFDPFDLSRVEVLRGPQGTLYGASSLGGLVKYVTNAPDTTKFETRVRGTVEATEGGAPSYQTNAMVNIPLSETLALRASGTYRKQGGFIDSIGTAGSDRQKNINDSRSYGGRVSLQWTPTAELRVRATAYLQNIEVDGPTLVESDPRTLKPLYGDLTLSRYLPSYSNVSYRLYNLLADYDFGFATLTSSTSYSAQRQRRRDDQTVFMNNVIAVYGPIYNLPAFNADTYLRQVTNNRKWTQEVRLTSGKSDLFEWLVGGYYTHENALIDQLYVPVTPGTLQTISYIPQFGGLGGANQPSTYEEYAGFANGTLHLGHHFDLDFGGRYSHNNQSTTLTGSGLLGGSGVPLTTRSSDGVFTYSVAPKVKFSDHAALYVRVAKGYRPGGPNTVPPGAPASVPVTFQPDTVTNYEVGIKAETANHAFSIDASGYHIRWKNIQLLAYVDNYGVNVNGTSANVDGAEVTATLRPVRGFVTSINGAFNNAVLDGDTDPLVLGAVKGDRLPFTPKFTVSWNTDYSWALTDSVKASIGGSIRSVSSQSGNYDPAYLAAYGHFAAIPAYEQVDLRASLDFGRFNLEAYVKNLNNSHGITNVLPPTSSGLPVYPGGAAATGILRPRTFGLSLTAGF